MRNRQFVWLRAVIIVIVVWWLGAFVGFAIAHHDVPVTRITNSDNP